MNIQYDVDHGRRTALRALSTASLAGCLPNAFGQDYPSRSITMILPFPPGGGFDTIGRPFAARLAKALNQPVIVDNRPGSGGNMGTEMAVRATADGCTLLFANDYLATNPSVNRKVRYDPLKDFTPIGMIGATQVVIAVGSASPIKSFKELVAASQTRSITYGTPGIGTSPHLLAEYLSFASGLKTTHVPYKGAAPSVIDAIGGQIDAVVGTMPAVASHIKAAKLRGIAVSGDRRSPMLPDVPTLKEVGLQISYEVWYCLLVPAKTPEGVQKRLRDATKVAIDADLGSKLAELGFEMRAGSSEEVTRVLKQDLARWHEVVDRAQIKPE